jgi:formylglycine-generating enzyme required for sulfatase activity
MARAPYPGLRAFERDEADIFFGRERQVDAMIDRLARHRFLAVTGTSGCGKSSLVRAGLLEALEMGLLAEAGPVWCFAIMRPREHPMAELASALLEALGGDASMEASALRRAALDRGPLSLVEELSERPLPEHANLLILVDQFEELFRYRDLASQEEAEAFVALLLATAGERELPIYIVLTMRSDFFGECARFEGLAEAVCDSIYLCPRLTRNQIIAAIEGPARVFGGRVEPALIARITNDMGTEPDQLPLMQHALMRLWEEALLHDRAAPLLRLDDYVAAGGLKASLSRHADEILAEVTQDAPQRNRVAQSLFCLVTEGEGERATRRLAPVAEVAAVSEQPIEEVANVADAFRAPGRSLLMPPLDQPLTAATVLDVSHESLIRQWDTLKEWERREAESVRQYREAEGNVRRWLGGRAALWQPEELRSLLAWRKQERPNTAWAARYGGDFQLLDPLFEQSRVRWKWARYAIIPAILLFAALVVLDIVRDIISDHAIAPNTIGGAVIVTICLAMSYRGIHTNFASGRTWTAISAVLFILGLTSQFVAVISGEKSWVSYVIPSAALAIVEIACLCFAFLQLRWLARVRHRRRWAWLTFLSGRVRRQHRDAAELAPSASPCVTSWPRDQVATDSRDLDLRPQVKEETEHWQAAVRRDAAITGAVVALLVIIGLGSAVMIWSGVRQVEVDMKFVAIQAGCSEMGSHDSEAGGLPDEGPAHRVCLKAFDLGAYEVTQGEWRRIMIFSDHSDPSSFKGNDRRPVENVSWNDAQRFIRVMSLFGHSQYRLPSEAEWEFAARAGTTTSRYWSDHIDDACTHENIADQSLKRTAPNNVVANCDDGYAETAPVGSFRPNPWGLYDMLGNVAGWVEDCYADNYRDAPVDGSPNTNEPCKARVVRGGSWITFPARVRAASRFGFLPDSRNNAIGFRVARTVTP